MLDNKVLEIDGSRRAPVGWLPSLIENENYRELLSLDKLSLYSNANSILLHWSSYSVTGLILSRGALHLLDDRINTNSSIYPNEFHDTDFQEVHHRESLQQGVTCYQGNLNLKIVLLPERRILYNWGLAHNEKNFNLGAIKLTREGIQEILKVSYTYFVPNIYSSSSVPIAWN